MLYVWYDITYILWYDLGFTNVYYEFARSCEYKSNLGASPFLSPITGRYTPQLGKNVEVQANSAINVLPKTLDH
jgi:hypothetical protein